MALRCRRRRARKQGPPPAMLGLNGSVRLHFASSKHALLIPCPTS
eukprot:CAMPEP_0172920820 /NCGR_PEP_ID=MMETSP1075-20121228/204788_1 /TAXON_ID=2916 /ORGANISM="Ceratium fusus, Strain PA161109" /LENGTH=44 /DNA_ID= /DNA_START= /DNA_END= /DNA_ORIENTATION=